MVYRGLVIIASNKCCHLNVQCHGCTCITFMLEMASNSLPLDKGNGYYILCQPQLVILCYSQMLGSHFLWSSIAMTWINFWNQDVTTVSVEQLMCMLINSSSGIKMTIHPTSFLNNTVSTKTVKLVWGCEMNLTTCIYRGTSNSVKDTIHLYIAIHFLNSPTILLM